MSLAPAKCFCSPVVIQNMMKYLLKLETEHASEQWLQSRSRVGTVKWSWMVWIQTPPNTGCCMDGGGFKAILFLPLSLMFVSLILSFSHFVPLCTAYCISLLDYSVQSQLNVSFLPNFGSNSKWTHTLISKQVAEINKLLKQSSHKALVGTRCINSDYLNQQQW